MKRRNFLELTTLAAISPISLGSIKFGKQWDFTPVLITSEEAGGVKQWTKINTDFAKEVEDYFIERLQKRNINFIEGSDHRQRSNPSRLSDCRFPFEIEWSDIGKYNRYKNEEFDIFVSSLDIEKDEIKQSLNPSRLFNKYIEDYLVDGFEEFAKNIPVTIPRLFYDPHVHKMNKFGFYYFADYHVKSKNKNS